jgi:hypothetical protein
MDNPEKFAKHGTQDEDKEKKRQHNMCRTPPHASQHKQHKQDMTFP